MRISAGPEGAGFTQSLNVEGIKIALFADTRQEQGFSALSLCGKLNVPAHTWRLSGKEIFPTQYVILKRYRGSGASDQFNLNKQTLKLWLQQSVHSAEL